MSGTLSPCDVFAHEDTDEIEMCSEMQNDQRENGVNIVTQWNPQRFYMSVSVVMLR